MTPMWQSHSFTCLSSRDGKPSTNLKVLEAVLLADWDLTHPSERPLQLSLYIALDIWWKCYISVTQIETCSKARYN